MVIRNKTIKKKKNVKIGGMAPVANAPKGKKPNKCDPAKLKTISHKKNAKMRLICNKYCSSKPTACGGYDEYGEVIPMERNTEVPLPPVTIEDYTTSEMTKEEAIEKHIEMFGKKPHHKMSTENIIKKLI